MAVGALRAHARRQRDLSVLAVDAHSDLREEYLDREEGLAKLEAEENPRVVNYVEKKLAD